MCFQLLSQSWSKIENDEVLKWPGMSSSDKSITHFCKWLNGFKYMFYLICFSWLSAVRNWCSSSVCWANVCVVLLLINHRANSDLLIVADTGNADSWMFLSEAANAGEIKQWPEFVWKKSGFILIFSIEDYWHGLTLKSYEIWSPVISLTPKDLKYGWLDLRLNC